MRGLQRPVIAVSLTRWREIPAREVRDGVARRLRDVPNAPVPDLLPVAGYREWNVMPVSRETWLTSLAV
jgi:hypothetical protein